MKNKNLNLIFNILTISLLFVGLIGLVLAHEGEGITDSHNGMMGGMWVFGWLFMILAIVALVLFTIWLIKELKNNKRVMHKKR